MNIALSKPSYLNWRYGGGQSLEPPTAPGDRNRQPFEFNRSEVGADDECHLAPFSGGKYAL